MSSDPVVVVGAGIAGTSVAYYLNKAGVNVTVIDRDSGTDNCSYGNAGMIVPSHIIPLASPGMIRKGLKWMLNPESPFYIRPRLNKELLKWGWLFKKASTESHVNASAPVLKKLLMTSRELLVQLEEKENIDFGFEKRGLFMFCNTRKGLEEEIEVVRKAHELDMPAEILTPDDVKRMEPKLNLDIAGATYFPLDAHLHPGSLMDNLKNLLASRGVRFIQHRNVTGITSDNRSVRTVIDQQGEEYPCSAVVICSGASSSDLTKVLGKRLPMLAGKGYSITLNNSKVMPDNCGIFAEAKVTMTPMMNTLRFGGTMEITGRDKNINPKKITGLKKSVCSYLPDFEMDDLNNRDVWVGLRPCSPDGMPYIGSMKGYDNLFVSTGHAMMGMSLAPAGGKLVAEMITQGESGLEHPLINPNRF